MVEDHYAREPSYLAPDETLIPRMQEDYPRHTNEDFYTDVKTCVRKAEKKD